MYTYVTYCQIMSRAFWLLFYLVIPILLLGSSCRSGSASWKGSGGRGAGFTMLSWRLRTAECEMQRIERIRKNDEIVMKEIERIYERCLRDIPRLFRNVSFPWHHTWCKNAWNKLSERLHVDAEQGPHSGSMLSHFCQWGIWNGLKWWFICGSYVVHHSLWNNFTPSHMMIMMSPYSTSHLYTTKVTLEKADPKPWRSLFVERSWVESWWLT